MALKLNLKAFQINSYFRVSHCTSIEDTPKIPQARSITHSSPSQAIDISLQLV